MTDYKGWCNPPEEMIVIKEKDKTDNKKPETSSTATDALVCAFDKFSYTLLK